MKDDQGIGKLICTSSSRAVLFSLLLGAFVLAACSGEAPSPEPPDEQELTATQTSIEDEEKETIMQWEAPPEMSIDSSKIYLATFETAEGEFKVELFADKAPKTVNNFVFLAREGFYDNTTFHRVLADFMAQAGDPTGTGGGGPGYRFEDEFHPDLVFDEAGYLAMANGGANTNGSQFFITLGPTPWLNEAHTIFGKVVEGLDVVFSLKLRDPSKNPGFSGDELVSVRIEEIPSSLLPSPDPSSDSTIPGDAPVQGKLGISPVLEEGRPLAQLEVSERENLYTTMPETVIDRTADYVATVETTKGNFVIELSPGNAPSSANNFVVLASLGYYDGFPIVFVEEGIFLITGSPAGGTLSDIGYTLRSEQNLTNSAGALSFWYRQDNLKTSGSQLMLTLTDLPEFDQFFSVFGYVTEGLEIAGSLTEEDFIKKITITENGEQFP